MTLRHGTGWRADPPDHRDRRFSADFAVKLALPSRLDLRVGAWSAPYDQGMTNSCSGQSIAFLYEASHVRRGLAAFVPSSGFVYWNERVLEGTSASDSGAFLRDGMKSINSTGVCAEPEWPLSRGMLSPPDQSCYASAAAHRSIEYRSIDRHVTDLKAAIATNLPVAFGFTLYTSIEAAEGSGDIPWPGAGESIEGHHAAVAVGYDDVAQRFLIRNSWGTAWGDGGYGTIPYAYLLHPDMSDDFWSLAGITN